MTSGYVGVAWSPVTQTIAPVGRQVAEHRVESLDRLLLDLGILRVSRHVGGFQVREDERVPLVESLEPELERARRSVGGSSVSAT